MIEAKLEGVAVSTAGEENQFLVLLKTKNRDVLPIVIGAPEATSIAAGLAKESLPRPMSHDLMISMLELFSASLSRVEITELAGGTFYAMLILDNRGVEFALDARPSDAIALAVRVSAPIFVSEEVIEQAALGDFPSGSESFEA
ncbi:bifunctional nuclease family protein [soil metagenome]|jgi:bifunctional DNase/RNase|nr:bifunctional nuclease family protein [Deinococcota bacterium]